MTKGNFSTMVWVAVFVLLAGVSRSSVNVIAPATLRAKYDQAKFDERISSFGKVPYGHTIMGVGKLPYPIDGCGESASVSYSGSDPLILVVQRGSCSFLEKVLNAQRLKAAAILIVNDYNRTFEHVEPVSAIKQMFATIPSTLIGHNEGSYLITDLQFQDGDAILAISYEIKTASVSEVIFKMKSNDYTLLETIYAIENMYPALKPNVKLVPALDISPGKGTQANRDCLKDYVACSDSRPGVTDNKDKLLYEMLRQGCILAISDYTVENWRIYASNFYDDCLTQKTDKKQGEYVSDLERCSRTIISKKLPDLEAKFIQCMSGVKVDGELDTKSTLAKFLQVNTEYQQMVSSTPEQSVMINGQLMYGDVTTTSVLKEICASLINKPEECTKIDKTDTITVNQTGKFTLAMAIIFFLKMVLVGTIILASFYICYKIKLRKEFVSMLKDKEDNPTPQQEADSVLNSYFSKKEPLDNTIDIAEEPVN